MHGLAADALARGALVVTPNKRLARELMLRHDEAQRAAGRRAWPSARALPWHAFVGELWQQALDAGLPLPAHRLDAAQATHLWQRIVASELAPEPLLDAALSADLAAEAWELVHAHGEGGASWRGFAASGPEIEKFVRWANAFEAETRRLDALDLARAPEALVEHARRLPGVGALDLVFAGFIEATPQQRRLVAALAEAGARVAWTAESQDAEVRRGRLFAAASPRDELVAALAWAADRARSEAKASVAIVVHDLAERRALVSALAEDVLCPGLAWPGREQAPRPYDLSAGTPLADVPIVAAALDLIALAHGPLDRERAAVLVRSRFLPGSATTRARRAGVERAWLEGGRRDLALPALAASLAHDDPALASRWAAAGRPDVPARASPRAFVQAWRTWLEALGWCDGVTLDPAEATARAAFHDLLTALTRLGAVAPRISRDDALRALRSTAQSQPFEPAAPGARVRILGVLEAAGLSFDAVWVAGLTADAWPRSPQPSPLLPADWQRARDVPRATPARELAYARALTAGLDACAREVVFSYAQVIDDHAARPSALVAHLPRLEAAIARPRPVAQAAFERRPVLERSSDARAPAWPTEAPFRGGAGLIERQSACPFQATATFRLQAQTWPDEVAGLQPTERGRFVHAALAAFWDEVHDQRTLAGLDAAALDAHVDRAVAAGRAVVDPQQWQALPPLVAALEAGHVARVMRRWLDLERERPPFTVEHTENRVALPLAGNALTLQIDRVDRDDASGARIVIDYKTGMAVAPSGWFGERPRAPQLALYAMALGDEVPIAALAFAQLKAAEIKAVGLTGDAVHWPALTTPDRVRGAALGGWDDARTRLREQVIALAAEVRSGVATIAPRDANACRLCGMQPLCRIAAADDGEEDRGDE